MTQKILLLNKRLKNNIMITKNLYFMKKNKNKIFKI